MGEKRKRYFCAMPPPRHFSFKLVNRAREDRTAEREREWLLLRNCEEIDESANFEIFSPAKVGQRMSGTKLELRIEMEQAQSRSRKHEINARLVPNKYEPVT